jgi:hypothetical protein
MLQAIRKLQKFVSGEEWKKYEFKPISGQAAETDDEIIAHIREKSSTYVQQLSLLPEHPFLTRAVNSFKYVACVWHGYCYGVLKDCC